ncbi:hypothetical protein OQA88_9459 [Cercophora sp. LCS_1]
MPISQILCASARLSLNTEQPPVRNVCRPKNAATPSERERQAIRHHTAANPLLTQRELSAWALDTLGRPVNQSTISDILKVEAYKQSEKDIFNADETGLFYTLANKPQSGSGKKKKDRITVMPTANADGTHVSGEGQLADKAAASQLKNTKVVFLPANVTSIYQPMD